MKELPCSLSGVKVSREGLLLASTAHAPKDLTSCLYCLNRYMLFPGAAVGLSRQSSHTVSFSA